MEEKGEDITTIKPPAPASNPDYVYCEYCERRFAPR